MHRLVSRSLAIAVLAAGILAALAPGLAHAQGTFFYGGNQRTWSNAASWWQSYIATAQTQSGSAPGASDTAVFNTSGSNAAGTAVFDGDRTIAGLRLLPTADGGLTLRGDGFADRTLTLGAGGIRTLTGNASAFTIGSTTANQGLNIVLGASQEWRRRTGSLTVNNNITSSATSGGSQTLVLSAPLSTPTFAGIISDNPTGGRTNLWLTVRDVAYLNPASTLTGTLTIQLTNYNNVITNSNQGSGIRWNGVAAQSGTLAIQELQLAGGAMFESNLTLSGSGTLRVLGGAADTMGRLFQTGTIVRPVGGGFLSVGDGYFTGVANDINLNGVIPWTLNQTTAAPDNTYMMFRDGTGTLRNVTAFTSPSPSGTPITGPGAFSFSNPATNYGGWQYAGRTSGANIAGTGAIEYLTSNFTGNTFWTLPSWYFDLNAQTWTTNAFTSNASVTIMSSGGGGGIVIGSSGELIIQQISGGAPTISAPIRESVANSWVTYGAASKFGNKGLGVLTLSGSNSHTGGTSLVSGSMNINHAYALGSGTFRINGNNITLDNRSGAPLTLATNNYNEWNTDFTFIGTQDLNLGTGTVSLGTWAGSTRTVTVNAGNLTIGGRIVDGSYAALPTTGIAKQGDGTLVLSGSNGYTGGTEVWGGELRFANKNALYGGDTTKWTAANILSGSGAVLSVSVGSGAGAFASGDLDTLAGLGTDSGGFQSGGYLGIDTTNVTGTYTYATNLANPGNSTSGTNALGIAKVGSGTLILSGTNTFTGGVLARGGRLLVTATNQVGPGTLVAAGGLLDLNGLTVSNSFAITSGTIANTTIAANKLSAAVTGPAVISGTLTGAGLGFMKSGTGTLALTGNNDYTGTTTVSAGLLSISSDANIGGTSAPLTFSGGGLQVTGATLTSLATGRTTTFSNNQPVTFEIVDPANTFTVSQPLQMGSGGLTKSGSGALVLSGNNTYTGATTLTGGTLRMGSANALGSGAALTVSGGVLDLNGNAISRSGSITFAGGLVTGGTVTATAVDYQGLSGTVAASLAGTRALVKSGTGVLVLSGSNSYSGITTVNSGSSMGFLQFAQTAALYGGTTTDWTKTKIVVNSGGVFAVSVGGAGEFGTSDVTTLLTGLGGAVNNNGLRAGSSIGFDTTNAGGSFTVTDTIADTTSTGGGAVGLVKLGAGTLILSASNTFTGQTVMGTYNGPNAGSLQLASTGFVSPTVVVYGGTFDTAGQNRTITTLSLGGGAPGSTAGLQTGSGTVTTGSNGVTYVALTGANGATISGNVSLGSASRTFLVNDSPAASVDLAVSAALTSGTLVKTGFGTLGLSGSNSFAGKLQVAQGTVEIDWINNSGNSPLGANTTTDLGSAAVAGTLRWVGTTSGTTSRTFNLSGTAGGGGGIDASGVGALVITSTVTAAAGSKTLTLGGTSTAANEIRSINNPTTGNASVVKDGPGLWRLTGTSGFAGGFTVKNGTIVAGVDTNGGTDAGVFGTSDTVIVGDESSGAAGTASLLLAPGVVSNKLLRVPATTGTQTVVLGGEASGATPRFENQIQLGRNVTLVAATGGTTSFGNTWASTGTAPLSANVSIGSAGRAGAVRLANSLATTGSVAVRFGTLDVLDARTLTAAGIVGIDSGATLAGVGRVAATLGGAGLVAPGNSPGILTADAFDPTGGLDLAFEFTGTAPDYANASASVNDVLRLTGTASAPFTTALTSANEIAVYLDVASLAEGNTFSGGFFTNLAGDFRSSIANAAYSYWVSGTGAGQTTYQSKTYVPLATAYPSLSMDVTTVATTATFSGESPTSGQVTQFTVVVPEPGAFALAALGLGLAGYALRRRRL